MSDGLRARVQGFILPSITNGLENGFLDASFRFPACLDFILDFLGVEVFADCAAARHKASGERDS